jgi:hypothetical protein
MVSGLRGGQAAVRLRANASERERVLVVLQAVPQHAVPVIEGKGRPAFSLDDRDRVLWHGLQYDEYPLAF